MKPLPLKDAVPQGVDCCDSCGYKTRHLHVATQALKRNDRVWLCDLCFSTYAGNATLYPAQYENGNVLRHICFVSNAILDAIREKK
jgi:ribosomal protein L37AE/L43A